jgi:hypothetical protein
MNDYEITGAGPFKTAFDIDTKGVIRREIVTYRTVDGMMRKEVATRTYWSETNYNDSVITIPLPKNGDA